jgi:2-polyprenyl-6-hydroxyphenyl methylase/3-demethylubiquinone-9 3-methyltransferase
MQVTRPAAVAAIRRGLMGHPLAVRAHVWGRFRSCPFLRTLHHVTEGDRVLDVGAGHGLFALLAVEAGAASVTAVEPDLRRPFVALRHRDVRFVAGFADALESRFDLVSLFDVLYRVPISERDGLLCALRGLLRPGGRLLIKEIDPAPPLKAAWNRAQEWMAEHFLGLGSGFYYESKSAVLERLARCGFLDAAVEDIGRFYPHAHVAYAARVADTAPERNRNAN